MLALPAVSRGPIRPQRGADPSCAAGSARRRRGVRALGAVLTALSLVSVLPVALAQDRPARSAQKGAAAEPPEDLRPALDKPVWYAPHAGCLDRLWAAGGDRAWVRRYPERSLRMSFNRVEREGGRWWYRFTWADGSAGRVLAPGVVDDLRFEALPATFYQTCFFLQPPADLAGYLRAQQPLAMQRYAAPGAQDRAREIGRIEQADRRRAGSGRREP